jgi:Family of unknown function (DUF5662)
VAYDSTQDTIAHIARVQQLLGQVIVDLQERAAIHDRSKLREPEKSMFDEFTPKLRDSTYGSEEYEGFRKSMGEALAHHYAHNRHHPEHFARGIASMNLLDVVEMLVDWKAATERHADGDLARSIAHNRERFGYGDEIEGLLHNTASDLGWLRAGDDGEEGEPDG